MKQHLLRLIPINTTGLPVFSTEEPSDLFKVTVCKTAGPTRDCGLCGRVYFDASGEFMDEGELDKFLIKQRSQPEKYHSYDGQPHSGYIDNKEVVVNCDCNGLKVYEDFFWRSRYILFEYLPERTKENLRIAQDEDSDAKKLTQLTD